MRERRAREAFARKFYTRFGSSNSKNRGEHVKTGAIAGFSVLGENRGVRSAPRNATRCDWARNDLSIAYHDREWGVPQHDDRVLFEFLLLEGAQAGLSWDTILRKRENYRAAFAGFDAKKIALYDKRKVRSLLANDGIVRNRLKLLSAVENARAFLIVSEEFGSFDRYIWQFVGGRPQTNARRRLGQVPARTRESDAMSKDLKKRGFSFVGTTICYAFMQAVGMVNDHLITCFRYREVQP
ncbi:MAG: DNA-3-methyladenine glycosylase I [Acidobacteria bacterium]|nr:DNA-3-methyladenine glycosylase I [Acidobacteriota bacterium]